MAVIDVEHLRKRYGEKATGHTIRAGGARCIRRRVHRRGSPVLPLGLEPHTTVGPELINSP